MPGAPGWPRPSPRSSRNFAVSGLASPLGGIVPAISLVCVATALPAVAIFLAVAPETAGQGLDETSLEQAPLAPGSNRYSWRPSRPMEISVVSRIPEPRSGPLSQTTRAPKVLLLHDGELADVAALLSELGAAITRAPRQRPRPRTPGPAGGW